MKNRRENGEVVVEASIVVTIVVIFISIMLYIGMILYQQSLTSVMANQTASNIAQIYNNNLRDPFTGYVDPDNAYQSVTYSNAKTDEYLDSIKQKGTALVQYRLKKSQIVPALERDIDVQVVKKNNEVLKGQIVVTITDKYNVPLVGFFGVDGGLTFSSTGRADCVDYLEYLLGVEAIANPEESPIPSLPDSDTCIVTFVKDKYSGGFHAAVPVLRGKTIITSNHQSHSSMPADPEFNGMKFTGWFTEDGKSFSANVQIDENITVYGTWECTVTFDPTGGTVKPTKKTVGYKQTMTFPIPTRYGYAFEGWYTEKDGAGAKYESGVTEIPGNITLYAKWRCTHAAFKKTMTDAGNCKTKSTWLYECKTCDYSYTDRGAYGPCVKGGNTVSVKPSCTTTGWYVANCKFCGRLMDDGIVDALGHKYASGNKGEYDTKFERAATCYRAGIKGSRCSRCGAEKGKELPLKNHNLERVVLGYGTCVSQEYGYDYCVNSGCDYSKDYTGDYGNHSYTGRCGTTHVYRTPVVDDCTCIDAKPGDFRSDIVIDACKDKRFSTFQCKVCVWCGRFETLNSGAVSNFGRELSNGTTIYSSRYVWCWDHHPVFEDIIPVIKLKNEHKVK